MKKSVFLKTFGCQMNVRDSELVCGLLKKAGYKIIDQPKQADIVIFNTCSVRQHAEDRVWSAIGGIAKNSHPRASENPKKEMDARFRGHDNNILTGRPIIGLIGCMAQNYKEGVFERSEDVDFVVGPADIEKIPNILQKLQERRKSDCLPAGQAGFAPPPAGIAMTGKNRRLSPNGGCPLFLTGDLKIWETDGQSRPEEVYHSGFYSEKDHAFVVISEGCSNFCSYCVVPYVRGPLRNRAYKNILQEIEEAIGNGIKRFTLLGQNVNAYEYEGVNFVRLLEQINSLKDSKEIDFMTSHPKDTSIELFKAIAGLEKLKKCLHLPLQSGSDRILKLMNRNYAQRFYLDLAHNYRKIVKNGTLSTDIIVGFSTESEADFQETVNLMKDVSFSAAYIFKYSPRPHTESFKMVDDVAQTEKERRHQVVLELQRKMSKQNR